MIFTLPPLPYATDALEPVMSRETIEYHYGKHLQTYIDNLNRLIAGTPYEEANLEEIILNADGPIFNNAAQAWNHTFFFNSLTPEHTEMPEKVRKVIERDFGSVETFKEKFQKAAVDLFGSGWAWLAKDKEGRLHILQEPNAGNPLKSGYKPLLTIDVWEHAYYIDYRNKRAVFAEKFWEIVNWNKVAERLECNCCCGGGKSKDVQKTEMSDEATADEDKDADEAKCR
ncbi:MAG: superoxide dismutase [Bacteroidales bacterium]|nr:superoxide dismutase [Bacteroidales bacterium]